MGGIKPLFNMGMIRDIVENFAQKVEDDVVEMLQYVGEEFVNRARDNRTYLDDTGNLRSSIGYVIAKDGQVIDMNLQRAPNADDGETGLLKAQETISEALTEFPRGYVLIGVAGMEYAFALENYHGIDVISSSANKVADDLKEIIELKNSQL